MIAIERSPANRLYARDGQTRSRQRKTTTVRRGSRAFRPLGTSPAIEHLEERQLLSGDLTQEISDLLTSESTGSFNLPNVSLGGFLTADSVNVSIQDVSHQGANWTATVGVTAGTAALGIGSSFSATIQGDSVQSAGVSGSYTLTNQPLGQGAYALTLAELDVTGASLFTGTAHEVAITYDPAAGTGQKLVHVGSLDAKLTPLAGTSATLTNLDIFDNGFSLENGSVQAGAFTLGKALAVTNPSVTFSGISYTAGSQPAGTVTLAVDSAALFPDSSSFTAEVDGFSGTYNLANPALSLSASEIKLKVGKILDADAKTLALAYDSTASPQFSVSAASVDLTSELFPHIAGSVTNFTADSNGISIGNATLQSTPATQTVDLGGVVEATGLSVALSGFDYHANPSAGQNSYDGTVSVSASSVSLFPGGTKPFSASVTGFTGSYNLNAQALSLSADALDVIVGKASDPVAELTATGLGFTLAPQSDGTETVGVTIGSANLSFAKLGVSGAVTDLAINNTGFSVGSATLSTTKTIAFGSVFSVQAPSVTVTNFGYTLGQAPTFVGSVSVSAAEIDLKLGGAASGKATGVKGTLSFAPGDLGHFTFTADTVDLTLGSFLDVSASKLTIDTAPAAGTDMVDVDDKVTATFKAGGASISGSASHFGIAADGTLVEKDGFGVTLTVDDAGKLKWPSWLPIQVTFAGISWPNFSANPTNFSITLSASVNVASLNNTGLQFSGFVQDATIDVGLLENGAFPITSIKGAGISVGGKIFGNTVKGSLFIATLETDSSGNPIADGSQTPVANSYLYGGIDGAIDMIGQGGFEIRLGISQFGLMDGFINVDEPRILDPDTGLAITNFHGSIHFASHLDAITDPSQLATNKSIVPDSQQSLADWQASLRTEVASVANGIAQGQSTLDALTSSIKIEAGATIFDAYATEDAFTLDADVIFDTTGKIEAVGTLTVGGGLSLHGGIYADFSSVTNGHVAILAYLLGPAQAPIVTAYGGIVFQYIGTPPPVASFTEPNLGTGLVLDGATSASATGVDLNSSSYTVEFWAQRRVPGHTEYVIGQDGSTIGNGLQIGFDDQNRFFVSSNGQTLDYANTDNAWHHWAVSYDQSTGTRVIYRDGISVATDTPDPLTGAGTTLVVGRSGTMYFAGGVDEVRVWNVARAATDITANFTQSVVPIDATLVADWKFNEGAGSTASDSSMNGLNATIRGNPKWALTTVFPPVPPAFNNFSITISGGADFSLPGLPGKLTVTGSVVFDVSPGQSSLDLTVNGTASIDPLGKLLTLDGKAHFDDQNSQPKLYGVFEVTTGDLTTLQSLGINVAGTAVLRFNTTSQDLSEPLLLTGQSTPVTFTLPHQSVSLLVNGSAGFMSGGKLWFTLKGELDAFFQVNTDANGTHPLLQLDFFGDLLVGDPASPTFDLNATGYFQIDDTGVAASVAATLVTSQALTSAGVDLRNNVFTILLNTTPNNITYTIPSINVPGKAANPAAGTVVSIPNTPPGASSPAKYLQIHGSGDLVIKNVFDLNGSFDLLISPGLFSVGLDMHFALMVGAATLESFHAVGGLTIDSSGLVAAVQATQDASSTQSYGFSVSAAFLLEANTTGQPRTVGSIALPAGNYAQVYGTGTLQLGSFVGTGTFVFSYNTASALMIHASLTEALGPLGTASAGGDLTIQGGTDPGLYGALNGSISTAASLKGIQLNAAAQLLINTTHSAKTVSGFTVNPDGTTGPVHAISILNGFQLQSGGTLTIAGLFGIAVAGEFDVAFDTSNIDIHAAATLNGFLGTHLGLNADIHILTGDSQHAGLIVNAGLSLGTNFGYGPLSISANPTLLVNTTGSQNFGVQPNTYQVELDNASFSVLGFQASGTLIVGVSNSVFSINVPTSNPVHVSFFGLGNIDISGYINSNGQFSLNGSIGFDFEAAGTGLYGSISASISNSGFSGSFNAGAKIAGSNVGSVGGSLVVETSHVHVVAWAQLGILPAVKLDFDLGSMPTAGTPSTIYWYSAPSTANEGDTITLNAAAAGSDGGALPDGNYHWTVGRNGQTFATGTGAAFPIKLGDPGTYQVYLTAIDPNTGALMQQGSTMVVVDVAPTVSSLNLQGVYASGIRQTFTPTIINHGTSGLTYAWSVTRNGAAFNPADGSSYTGSSFSFTPPTPNNSYNAPDIYAITLVVTDAYGGTTRSTATTAVLDPTNVSVNTTADDGSGISLRSAIALEAQLPQSYEIHFAPSLAGQTIYLTQIGDPVDHGTSALLIPNGKTIVLDATDVPGITLNGSVSTVKRLFFVAPGASLTLMNLTLTGGNAVGSENQAEGGAIFSDGQLTLESCTLINNYAIGIMGKGLNALEPDAEGGAVYQNLSPSASYFWSLNCTYTGNYAVAADGTGQLVSYPIAGGTAYAYDQGGTAYGGAIFNLAGAFLYNNTIVNNTARAGANYAHAPVGGGFYEPPNAIGQFLANNIIYGNLARYNASVAYPDDCDYTPNGVTFGGSNLINAPGSGVAPSIILSRANPMLGPLGDHGNGIQTYSLLPGSPALNAGNAGLTGGVPFDGRGRPRVVNNQVDIGAFEHQTYVVTNLNDYGTGSLRAAVNSDDDGSQITFAPNLAPGAVQLTSGSIPIFSSLSIIGPGANLLTIDANGISRIFVVEPGVTASISGLTLADGHATQGGAIYNLGNVIVNNSLFVNDTASYDTANAGAGGAIYNASGTSLVVTNSTFAHDSASGPIGPVAGVPNAYGGAIFNSPGASLSATNDTFDSDSAQAGSFAIGRYGADGSVIYCNSFNAFSSFNKPPAYVAPTMTGASFYTWSLSTGDPRALVNPNAPSSRIATTIYSTTTMSIDLPFTDGKAHQVSLYLLDFDGNNSRSERIDVTNANGTVLDSRTVSSFSAGEYLTWVVSGHVQFKVTNLNSGTNAVVSGLFFDPAPAGITGPATFVGVDTVSQGNWQGTAGMAVGGAIENQGIASISGSTFSGSSLSAFPAGVAAGAEIDNAVGATLILFNDLAANSTGASDIANSGSLYGGHVLATTSSGVPASMLLNVGAGPALSALAKNGGTIPTISLQRTSTALDAGDNAAAVSPLSGTAGLVDWFRGDGNAQDSTGRSSGTLNGNVSFAPGEVGQAFNFGGAGYVALPASADLVGSVAFTVSAWVKTTAANGVIIQQRDASNFNGEYVLAVSNGLANFWAYGNGQLDFNFSSSRAINDGQWHQVTAVRSASGAGQIYIDGVLSASASGTIEPLGSNMNVYIGADVRAIAFGDPPLYFTGLIDDVAVFNRALTPAEVQTIATTSSAVTDERGLPRVVNGTVDVGALEAQPYVVTNLNDSGPGSLRQAIADDISGDQPVVFAPSLAKRTITLTSGPISVGHNLTINGLGADQITLSGGNAVEDFIISSGTVTIAGLTIANGVALQGGGIYNAGNLTLVNDALVNDVARNDPAIGGGRVGQGGAIYNAAGASLTVTGSTFSGDSVTGISVTGLDGRGGAIYNAPTAIFSATNDTFAANLAQSQKGYGIDGYVIFGDKDATPSYAVNSVIGASFYPWTLSTTDPRALQKSAATATDRIAGAFYASSSLVVDVNLTDSKPHRVTLYLLDYDTANGRSERIDLINPTTGAVLDSRTASSFSGGLYLTWVVSGHVQFKITNTAGQYNAVISGLFYDPAPAGVSGPATFLGADTTTQGNWRGSTAVTGFGGAIDNAGTATISNSTIATNSVSGTGDGAGIANEAGATLKLFDSIVAKDVRGHDVFNLGSLTGTSNLVTTNQGISAGVILSTADPLLGPLQNNGGSTSTMSLGTGSPALDTGDSTNAPVTDQRGMARIVGTGIDLGAFESVGGPPSADAGDGYVIHAGDSVTLSAADSFDPAGVPLTYSWDINGDGTFGDATGVSPTLTWQQLSALHIQPRTAPYMISVKVTNDDDTTPSTLVSLTVLPALRVTSLSTSGPAVTHTAVDGFTVTFSNPIDPSTLNSAALSLTRDGASIPLDVPLEVELVAGSPATYTVSGLFALTQADGAYVLTLDAGTVSDAAGSGSGKVTASWTMDATAPASRIHPLAATQNSTSFVVTVGGISPAATTHAFVSSGPVAIDLYVSKNNGPFILWTTVPPTNPTAVFHGEQNTSYAFFSVARDAAGNVQTPSNGLVRTFVPDLTAPKTQITAVDSTLPTFHVNVSGTDAGGSSLATIRLFAQVDGGPSHLAGSISASSGTITYQAIVDGVSHTYRFFTQGIDAAGNVETLTNNVANATVVHSTFYPAPLIGVVVQGGSTDKSYVRTVDLVFSANEDVASLVSGNHLHLTKQDFSGSAPMPIPLTGVVHVVDHAIELDFGAGGIGGNPNSFAGDGSYEISVDGSPNTFTFVRRLGDVNGDGLVNNADLNLIRRSLGSKHPNLKADVNGDGKINRSDLALAMKAIARAHTHAPKPPKRK